MLENSAPIRKDTVVGLGAPGADRRDGDIVDRRRTCSASGAARRGRHSDADRGLDRGAIDPRHPAQCRSGAGRQPRRHQGCDARLRDLYRDLAGKGDEIDSVLRKADTAFARFDSGIDQDRRYRAGPCQRQGRRTVSKVASRSTNWPRASTSVRPRSWKKAAARCSTSAKVPARWPANSIRRAQVASRAAPRRAPARGLRRRRPHVSAAR